jgi:hypothetical protein
MEASGNVAIHYIRQGNKKKKHGSQAVQSKKQKGDDEGDKNNS